MNLLFDTNILIHLARDYSLKLLQQINLDGDKIFISVATVKTQCIPQKASQL